MLIVALAIGLALGIQAVLVKPYQIPSPSMEPTLDPGQRVLVDRLGYRLGDPEIGDVVVFHPPVGAVPEEEAERAKEEAEETGEGREPVDSNQCGVPREQGQPCPEPDEEEAETNFIKRIVAGPGDRLRIEDGHPVVNGEVAEEDFIRPCRDLGGCNLPEEIIIPADHYFMMGDNRGQSDDSRYWGPVPRDWIIGEAFFTYWPPTRVGLL